MADKQPAEKQANSKNLNSRPDLENDFETETVKRRVSGKVVVVCILVGLIAFAGVSYYFNLFGVKTKVIEFFRSQDPEYQTVVANYEEQKQAYEQKAAELGEKEKSLAAKEKQLQEKEQQSTATGSATSASAGGDISAAAEIFENMDKNAAAEIFNNTTNDAWIARVLSTIDEKKAAQILGAMDPAKASIVSSYIS